MEGCRAFQYPGPWMHMPACLTHTKHTHAGCHPHSHTAFQTTWIGHSDSPQHLYSPSRMHTHPFHRPPWPELQNWSCCRASRWQAPSDLYSAAFFQQSLTPSTVFSGNWCLTRLLCTLFIYFLFLPPRPSCQESCSPNGHRRQRTEGGLLRSPDPVHQAHQVSQWP